MPAIVGVFLTLILMKKILITGFEPFNGRDINPSERLLNDIKNRDNAVIAKKLLPVEYRASEEIFRNTVKKEQPDYILSLGQAGNMPHLSIEYIAVNLDSTKSSDGKTILPDASGYAPILEPIIKGGNNALFSTLPVWEIIEALNENNVPAKLSYSAGTYICNHIMYIGCLLAEESGSMKSGFVHVPFLPQQLINEGDIAGKYSMEYSVMLKGVELIIDSLVFPTHPC